MQAIVIPDKILTEINTLLFRFLWRKRDCNKKAFEKVKRSVIISDTEKGGINMIDIKMVQQSFLCEWLLKLANSPNTSKWSWIPKVYFSKFGSNLVCFNSTIGPRKFKGLENITSVFWKEVATVWLNNNKVHTAHNVKMECLWNNASIMYQNNVIYFKSWALQGINFVHDMITNNRILTFDEVRQKLRNCPSLYLEYRVIHSALLTFLTNHPSYRTENITNTPSLLFNNCQMNKAKSFRMFMTDKRYSEPCSIGFWRNKFNITIEKHHWCLPKLCSKESRIRELQWKILHNIYPTNILLSKMGITMNNKCPYCVTEVDFIEHFFVKCKQIKTIWIKVKDIFHQKHNKTVQLSEEHILFGVVVNLDLTADEKISLNNLILIAKMCISKYRYGTPINLGVMFEKELILRKLLKH